MFNITSQWKDHEILIFVRIVYNEKLGCMLKPLVTKFCFDLWLCLMDISEKQVSAKLKTIVVAAPWIYVFQVFQRNVSMLPGKTRHFGPSLQSI